MKYYTGIGSRKTPRDIFLIMKDLAVRLARDGWTLRSGGASGADTAFEQGAALVNGRNQIFFAKDATEESMSIAANFHAAWDKCSDYAKRLHGRNTFQVLGPDLATYSKFVVCWTPDGATTHEERSIATGGTGTAISIANAYGVPVFNLQRKDHLDRVLAFLNKSL